jgi:hypothetical protein
MILPEEGRQSATGSQKKSNRTETLELVSPLVPRSGILIHVDLRHEQQVEDLELVVLLQVV